MSRAVSIALLARRAESVRRAAPRTAGLLGLDDHPALQVGPGGRRPGASKICVILSKIVYHCDLQNMFLNSRAAARRHNERKREDTEQAARLVRGGQGLKRLGRPAVQADGRLDSIERFFRIRLFGSVPKNR